MEKKILFFGILIMLLYMILGVPDGPVEAPAKKYCLNHEYGSKIVDVVFDCFWGMTNACRDSLKKCAGLFDELGNNCCECLKNYKEQCKNYILDN